MSNKKINLEAKVRCEGLVFETNNSGMAEVVDYINKKKVGVKFLETGSIQYFWMKDVKKGNIRDCLTSKVCGVGLKGFANSLDEDGNKSRFYTLWGSAIKRCYSKTKSKDNSYYNRCSVSEEFRDYSFFKSWCEEQVGCEEVGWHLDKDLIKKGNLEYSPKFCCFLPPEVNTAIIRSKSWSSDLPQGVSMSTDKKKFRARISVDGIGKHLGVFNTVEEAFLVYKKEKETYLKVLAERWKGRIDSRAYEALINWEVNIDD